MVCGSSHACCWVTLPVLPYRCLIPAATPYARGTRTDALYHRIVATATRSANTHCRDAILLPPSMLRAYPVQRGRLPGHPTATPHSPALLPPHPTPPFCQVTIALFVTVDNDRVDAMPRGAGLPACVWFVGNDAAKATRSATIDSCLLLTWRLLLRTATPLRRAFAVMTRARAVRCRTRACYRCRVACHHDVLRIRTPPAIHLLVLSL